MSRALRAPLHAANWWFESRNGQCFVVFRSHIFFFKIFPKINCLYNTGELLQYDCKIIKLPPSFKIR